MIVISNSLFTCKSLHQAINGPQGRPKYDQRDAPVDDVPNILIAVSLLAVVGANELKTYHQKDVEEGHQAVKPCLEISIGCNKDSGDYEHQRIDNSENREG